MKKYVFYGKSFTLSHDRRPDFPILSSDIWHILLVQRLIYGEPDQKIREYSQRDAPLVSSGPDYHKSTTSIDHSF